jgi:large subunit ribosomal protein L6
MSRIGRRPIPITKGVTVSVDPGAVAVKGPKGSMNIPVPGGVNVRTDDGNLLVEVAGTTQREKALHGLVRSLIANAVAGVTTGFTRDLEIQGIGYKAAVEGREIVLALGFSHPVRFPIPEGIDVSVDKQVRLSIKGYDKQVVGQVAANLRALRPPDVYKGKGIRYAGEIVRKKVGKAGAK